MIDVKVTKSNNDATKNVKQSYNLQQELLNCLLRDGLRFLIKITSLIRSENSSSVLSSILSYQYYTCSDSSNDDHRMRISSILLELISSAGLNYELTKSMNCWLICGIYGILDALVSHFKALNFTREISHFPEMLFIRTYRKQQVWAEEEEGVGQRSLPPGCLKEKQFRKSFGQDTISNEMRITSHAVQRSSTEDCISSLWLTSSPPNLYRQLEMVWSINSCGWGRAVFVVNQLRSLAPTIGKEVLWFVECFMDMILIMRKEHVNLAEFFINVGKDCHEYLKEAILDLWH